MADATTRGRLERIVRQAACGRATMPRPTVSPKNNRCRRPPSGPHSTRVREQWKQPKNCQHSSVPFTRERNFSGARCTCKRGLKEESLIRKNSRPNSLCPRGGDAPCRRSFSEHKCFWRLTPELRGAAKRHPLERIVMRQPTAQTDQTSCPIRAGRVGTHERYTNCRLSEHLAKAVLATP